MSRLEDRLRDALHAGTDDVEPAPDLFARVQRSVEEDRRRRRFRTRVALGAAAALAALAAFVLLTTDYQDGELHMDWWIFEVIVTVVLVAIAIILGPFIKRFGKTYAAEVFRSNPATGKSFIVLTDVAYYLIFTAYILFTTKFDPPTDWESTVTAPQVQYGLARGRRDPADHRRAARRQSADPADHRTPAHAQSAARSADARGRGPRSPGRRDGDGDVTSATRWPVTRGLHSDVCSSCVHSSTDSAVRSSSSPEHWPASPGESSSDCGCGSSRRTPSSPGEGRSTSSARPRSSASAWRAQLPVGDRRGGGPAASPACSVASR